ncbi:hypothetical protein HELRODRAFT_71964 [Helobdella robusta]|uniref:phosphoethanolamine N-methyltransferase n=1 Tax=Helobdella robusta TaxID=6412 RepID=T1G0T6_HELRO|nr:hypothetical protein HELRODRAFT_71964 [Helobdella robusta]ESO11039.1 hypothetical protein HELRODRAFT_71964 [Helobdella robusta]
MQNFWKEHSTKANEEEMMLDSDADTLGREEVPEILSLLPGLEGKSVLELGAGIGRFSGRIAAKAKSVVAVDFMENFIKCNESTNGHHGNIQFVQADVMLLKFPENSFDLVFSNWLLMYLEEDEVCTLFEKIFNWLKPGGHFFFRESCFHQSGNKSRTCNPSKYRHPSTYNDILGSLSSFLLTSSSSQASSPCAMYDVKLVFSKPIQTYIKVMGVY